VDIAAVYHGPLAEFVARRTALARALRPGDADAAAAVGKLRKPPVSVWAIDQLAVEHPDLVTEVLAAGADAREAQQAVAGGARNGEDLLLASARVREAVEAAVRAATTVLGRSGRGTTDQTARRLRITLQAAVSGGARERMALWRGTLDRDLEPTGFGTPDAIEADAPELAQVLAPLRRRTSGQRDRSAPVRSRQESDLVARHAAERAAAEQDKAAERARGVATTKRQHAQRLAEQARAAQDEATAAEQAAEAAETAARAARPVRDR
jgi:hypothetical protein